MDAVPTRPRGKCLFPLQTLSNSRQESASRVVFRTHEKHRQFPLNSFQAGANCDLFFCGKRRTYNSEVILPSQYPARGLINREKDVGGVAGLGQNVGTRTQARNVASNHEYSVRPRTGGASGHLCMVNIP